ncbi:hypothetical protein FA95DRAFT_1612903 [Auriscalpium vulgare]|uniref:Uncharacterized protein n=1 Tax=Auriscalpium vulgare TaxID=40419 RepID=A0ACB8R5E9_9AGAM|nr:hypothetical protein FA95DRAFT_1612903 [Auriscalpium vulgare]
MHRDPRRRTPNRADALRPPQTHPDPRRRTPTRTHAPRPTQTHLEPRRHPHARASHLHPTRTPAHRARTPPARPRVAPAPRPRVAPTPQPRARTQPARLCVAPAPRPRVAPAPSLHARTTPARLHHARGAFLASTSENHKDSLSITLDSFIPPTPRCTSTYRTPQSILPPSPPARWTTPRPSTVFGCATDTVTALCTARRASIPLPMDGHTTCTHSPPRKEHAAISSAFPAVLTTELGVLRCAPRILLESTIATTARSTAMPPRHNLLNMPCRPGTPVSTKLCSAAPPPPASCARPRNVSAHPGSTPTTNGHTSRAHSPPSMQRDIFIFGTMSAQKSLAAQARTGRDPFDEQRTAPSVLHALLTTTSRSTSALDPFKYHNGLPHSATSWRDVYGYQQRRDTRRRPAVQGCITCPGMKFPSGSTLAPQAEDVPEISKTRVCHAYGYGT